MNGGGLDLELMPKQAFQSIDIEDGLAKQESMDTTSADTPHRFDTVSSLTRLFTRDASKVALSTTAQCRSAAHWQQSHWQMCNQAKTPNRVSWNIRFLLLDCTSKCQQYVSLHWRGLYRNGHDSITFLQL